LEPGKQGTEITMSLLRRPLYQRNEGADEDLWRLVFDTDTNRLFVEYENKRGDMRGSGYATSIEEIDSAAFLGERGPGQQELTRLLKGLFEDRQGAERVFGHVAA
jgi:ABC-type transport system involved in cytochrome bd biosynthesis fused ATPase/permease subunit